MNGRQYSFRRWVIVGVPVVVGIALVAAGTVHYRYGVGWGQLIGALFVAVGFQVAWYIAMFWARRHYLATRDLRLGVAISGAYLLGIVLTLDHYLLRWKIVSTNRFVGDAIQIPIYTAIGVVLFSMWRGRERAKKTEG
jgi:hypothetical protein